MSWRVLTIALMACAAASGPSLAQAPAKKLEKPPQLLVDVSALLADAAARQDVDRTEPFEDVIKDTPVAGTRRTVGVVRAEPVPDDYRGAVDFVFSGTTYSCSTGFRHFVMVGTSTVAPFEVRQRLFINSNRLTSVRGPAWARACITLLGAVNRDGEADAIAPALARFGFPQEKEELEAIVSAKTARETAERFEAELNEAVATASREVGRALRFVKETGITIESLNFSSTGDNVQGRLRITAPADAVWSLPPALPAKADLSVRVHESLINGAARSALGGKELRLSEVRGDLDRLIGTFIKDTRKDKDREDALTALNKLFEKLTGAKSRITLAAADPVVLRFADDVVTIEVHIAKMALDGAEFDGLRVRVAYRVENTDGAIVATRVGPIRFVPVDAPKDKKLEAAAVALRLLVEALAAELFPPRERLDDLPLPKELAHIGRLRAARAEARDGWLTLAWRLEPRKSK